MGLRAAFMDLIQVPHVKLQCSNTTLTNRAWLLEAGAVISPIDLFLHFLERKGDPAHRRN